MKKMTMREAYEAGEGAAESVVSFINLLLAYNPNPTSAEMTACIEEAVSELVEIYERNGMKLGFASGGMFSRQFTEHMERAGMNEATLKKLDFYLTTKLKFK